jgi:hypothetical protein
LKVLGVEQEKDKRDGADKTEPLVAWARVSGAIGICHSFSFSDWNPHDVRSAA